MNQDDYQKEYDALVDKYDKAKEEYDTITEQINSKQVQRERFKGIIETLKKQDGIIT